MRRSSELNGANQNRDNPVQTAQRGQRRRLLQYMIGPLMVAATAAALTGCGSASTSNGTTRKAAPQSQSAPTGDSPAIEAVAAEPQYGDLVRQIGGSQVDVHVLINNPNIDPHDYQAGTSDAKLVARAGIVVQNGLGYDSFMNQLESASPNSARKVVEAGQVLHGTTGVTNPHLWYKPGAMVRVATVIETDLATLRPADRQVFEHNLQQFKQSLLPWQSEISAIKSRFAGTDVAVTEPVADYLLQAAGLTIQTPVAFESAVMNGTDPSPQSVNEQEALLNNHQVKILVYNEQATDSVTASLLALAKSDGIPVVPVYETMPPGLTYATWMTSETKEIYTILSQGK